MRDQFIFPTIALLTLATPGALGGVIRHDVDDAIYQNLAAQEQFAAVGALAISYASGASGSCSGTLVSSEWVLTAAHCVDRVVDSATFLNNQAFAFTGEIIVHPEWTRNDFLSGADLALVRLQNPITTIEASQIYTGRDELGQVGTSVGYGRTGTGLTGALPGTAGTLRAGNNVLDVLGTDRGWDERIILTDFDSPLDPNESNYGDSAPLDLEYSIAPGDSGGPMFIETPMGWRLVGITSFVNSTDGFPNADYGDSNGFTRVSDYAGWINSIIPAPGTLPMLAGGLLFGAHRRRAV